MSQEDKSIYNDYLWDASGQPDPEIQRLESALARFRQSRPAPEWPQADLAAAKTAWWSEIQLSLRTLRLAAATVVALAIGAALWLSYSPTAPLSDRIAWDVELSPAGGESKAIDASSSKRKIHLEVGAALQTDAVSKASIAVGEIGRLEVEPGTRLRLLQSTSGRKRIALDRGTIHAAIWARPGQFVVDTPSAVAVDLGCMYTLQVDETGDGILRTTLGWVGFRWNGLESFTPAGAACPTHARSGPGIPYFEDASEAFRSALSQLDSRHEPPVSLATTLDIVLKGARPRDGLTLWHLLSRLNGAERAAVYQRLAALVPPPRDVTRDGILELDRAMLDSWWNALDLGDISIWRHWEQQWTATENSPR
jgi:hypothetical protein